MEIDTMMEAGAVWTSRGCAVVVYHGGCVDGLFAAAVTERALKARGWQVELYAAEHKRPLPAFPLAQHIVCVDFCPPADELQDLRAACPDVTVIDHHDSARELLMGVRSMLEVVFDLDESGATLAWRYYFPDKPIPLLLAYVRDRDLWRWSLCASQAVNASLQKLKAHPDAPFSVNFSVLDDGRVRFSVRGADRLHLGELMRDTFGGGGHPNAAGAMFPSLAVLDAACPAVKGGA